MSPSGSDTRAILDDDIKLYIRLSGQFFESIFLLSCVYKLQTYFKGAANDAR
jgi:hypothetical protein